MRLAKISYPLADELVERIVGFWRWAVDHVPMITNQHSLLEKCRVGACITELPSLFVAHVINLAVSFRICIVAAASATTRKARFRNHICRLLWTRKRNEMKLFVKCRSTTMCEKTAFHKPFNRKRKQSKSINICTFAQLDFNVYQRWQFNNCYNKTNINRTLSVASIAGSSDFSLRWICIRSTVHILCLLSLQNQSRRLCSVIVFSSLDSWRRQKM